jgi:hypothetical protein
MNERIRELAAEAGMILGDVSEFDMAKFMPKEVKFAELIIQECFQACMTEGASYEEKAAGA